MIDRRHLISVIPALAIAPRAMARDRHVTLAELETEFEKRDIIARKSIQTGLAEAGYYTGAIDGAWGPGTAEAFRALMQSPHYKSITADWTSSHRVQVVETLFFPTSDAYDSQGRPKTGAAPQGK